MEIKNFMITITDTEKGTRFMAAEPLLKPTFNSQKNKFKSDLERLLK